MLLDAEVPRRRFVAAVGRISCDNDWPKHETGVLVLQVLQIVSTKTGGCRQCRGGMINNRTQVAWLKKVGPTRNRLARHIRTVEESTKKKDINPEGAEGAKACRQALD